MVDLRISLQLQEASETLFLTVYQQEYVPAIRGQQGFRFTRLLKSVGIGEPRFEIHIGFASESLRRQWVASPEHSRVWPQVASLCREINDQLYEVIPFATAIEILTCSEFVTEVTDS